MVTRTQRLKQLVSLQERMKEIHETRRAGFLAKAAAADRDIAEVLARRTDDGSLSDLFPDVYARFVDRAIATRRENEDLAAEEGRKVAAETARTNMAERTYRDALRDDQRRSEERAALDAVEQRLVRD
jgi:hypothetical protein